MTDREEFLEIFRTHVTRPGSEKLLDWIDSKTDFFSAPASTRFHGACDGGLCAHSLNVYRVLHGTFFTPDKDSEETFAICALLHDLCKANFYKKGTRNVKNEATGQWEKVPSYSVEDMFPYGHGEKSVFLIERFMKLKVEEAVAPDMAKLPPRTASSKPPMCQRMATASSTLSFMKRSMRNTLFSPWP